MKALALVAVFLLVGACTQAGSSAPASIDAPAPSIVESTAKASPSPPGVPADMWGPLAVRPAEDGADTARHEGTLRITDTCVYLEAAGGELTFLTWLADRTTWNGVSRTITFANFDGTVVTIGDGDHVVLGGGEAESDISAETWINEREWVAPPASSCSLDLRWAVGAVEGETTAVASIDPSWVTQPALTCDSDALAFPSSALDAPTGAELEPDPAASALRVFVAGPDAPTNWDPAPAWRRVLQTPQAVVFLGDSAASGARPFVAFSLSASGWTLEAAGECHLRVVLPEGLGSATWEVDPASPITPDSTSVRVLAREIACSGGKDPSERMIAPVVIVDQDGVTILLAARILPGGHDCPGNPIVEVRVDLPEPIGERHLYDGGVFPPAERK